MSERDNFNVAEKITFNCTYPSFQTKQILLNDVSFTLDRTLTVKFLFIFFLYTMSFNKIKAMRSAERYLTQGKIQAAISEYKLIVENAPKDINSKNMLGDLYVKSKDTQAAVNCYREVAEYYNSQGFAKKAISIYNKLYRLEPESVDIIISLAELYKLRGSMAEAHQYYEILAKRFEEKGRKLEALEIWKKIAEISPRDNQIYLKIAESFWQAEQLQEAAKAYIEAGKRLLAADRLEEAAMCFARSLEVNPDDFRALKGFVKSQIALGYPEKGVKALEEIYAADPTDKEINYLLMDCYFEMNNPEKAEEIIVKMVEREPANYPKLLDLVGIYLEADNLDSAVRILDMTSEHLLVSGEADQLLELLNEVFARNPEHLAGLRLLTRYYGWQKDEAGLQQTLERLAESARLNESFEDERFALTQYLLLVPHDVDFANRLSELKELHDFDEDEFEERAILQNKTEEIPNFESFSELSADKDTDDENGFEILSASDITVTDEFDGNPAGQTEQVEAVTDEKLAPSDELKVYDEIESVKFYIEQGYQSLAEKSLSELENKFGNRQEFIELRRQLTDSSQKPSQSEPENNESSVSEIESFSKNGDESADYREVQKIEVETFADYENVYSENETIAADETNKTDENITEDAAEKSKEYFNTFDSFKDEIGLDEAGDAVQNDYDEHYHHAVVYQEMGMLDEAIREFQDAVNCVEPNDGTNRFLNCSTLIGHCFMEKEMPKLALNWFENALESCHLGNQEKQGLHYELANAHEANDENDKALEQFEIIYSMDIDYRDVSKRLESLRENILTAV